MEFIVRGKLVVLTQGQVAKAVAGLTANPIVKYAVQIGDDWYPPKQVVAAASGLPVAAFTTQDAFHILDRLGFRIITSEVGKNGVKQRGGNRFERDAT